MRKLVLAVLFIGCLFMTGCKAKRLFTSPPHGDSWSMYDQEQECEKRCETPNEYQSCECAD